ncbi:hypothetical protein SLEP1_g29285 [Rubroshorea leprosula]|nr:hypothetical protein SLEP1_g29285 [Rubroshorea leprosula]
MARTRSQTRRRQAEAAAPVGNNNGEVARTRSQTPRERAAEATAPAVNNNRGGNNGLLGHNNGLAVNHNGVVGGDDNGIVTSGNNGTSVTGDNNAVVIGHNPTVGTGHHVVVTGLRVIAAGVVARDNNDSVAAGNNDGVAAGDIAPLSRLLPFLSAYLRDTLGPAKRQLLHLQEVAGCQPVAAGLLKFQLLFVFIKISFRIYFRISNGSSVSQDLRINPIHGPVNPPNPDEAPPLPLCRRGE